MLRGQRARRRVGEGASRWAWDVHLPYYAVISMGLVPATGGLGLG